MKIARYGVLLLATAAAGTLYAAEPSGPAYTDVMVAGVKVGLDPATGRLRPLTVQESKALERALAEGAAKTPLQQRIAAPQTLSDAQKTQVRIAGGGFAMKLPMSEMSTVKATRGDDGSLMLDHDGQAQAPAREMADE